MLLVWFAYPTTSCGEISCVSSNPGFKYMFASLVGFFELLAYGTYKKSYRITLVATMVGIVGFVIASTTIPLS
jgi:succinate-acetate transporter protein